MDKPSLVANGQALVGSLWTSPGTKLWTNFFTDSGESWIVDESGYWIRLDKKVVNQRVESYRYDATGII